MAHEDASTAIAKLTIGEKCRKRAADEELPLRQIFDDVCREASADAAEQVSFANLESSMYKRRRTFSATLNCSRCKIYQTTAST